MRIIASFLILFFCLTFFSTPLYAAELYINTDGWVQINNAEITHLNNNFITVTLWGTRWVLFVDVADSNVKVTNAGGEPITIWDLVKGHTIYVEGRTRDAGPGKIEINVGLLRDMSIAGSKSVIPTPAVIPLKPTEVVATPLPIPAPEASSSVVSSAAPGQVVSSSAYLSRGAKGEAVSELQSALLSYGFLKEDEVTGFFGPATEAAVKKLQASGGLEQVGFVGSRTKELLLSFKVKPESQSAPLVSTGESFSGEFLTSRLDTGMRGKEVILLQEFLQKNNFGIPSDGPVTGYYGRVTAKAVASFQKANGLEPVGFVGPETRELLNKYLASTDAAGSIVEKTPPQEITTSKESVNKKITKTLRQGMRGEEVKILQEFLQTSDLGIPSDGPVTGYYGAVTSRAVAKFQQANGLEAVGFVGQATRELINKLLGE